MISSFYSCSGSACLCASGRVFDKVKHKYWKHGSLALVVPPILIGVAAYFLLPNATPKLKEMIQVVWTTMSPGVIIGWALAIVMQKTNDKVNGGK